MFASDLKKLIHVTVEVQGNSFNVNKLCELFATIHIFPC